MPDFVSYRPVRVESNIQSTPFMSQIPIFQGPYFSEVSEASEPVQTSQKAFSWTSGGATETPYSYKTVTTQQTVGQETPSPYKNANLGEALRRSADYARTHAKDKSSHQCAKYVSDALEQSGISGFNRQHGWNYDKVVSSLGMQEVTGQQTYMKGDIAVTKTNDGTGHVAICNKDGASINDSDAWSSDFNSSAHPYEKSRITYAKIFRAKQGLKLIKKAKYGY